VKAAAALLLALLASSGRAATAYVTDELVLGVYADQKTQGERLTTLRSGAAVETLGVSGDSTRVRLAGGVVGWVKTAYLTNSEPATVRIKQLQEELDRTRATTPALAEAAERSEVARLTRELEQRQSNPASFAGGSAAADRSPRVWVWIAAVCLALGCGFWLGYAALARRIKQNFGGIKVY
jgi:SH3 domain protein